MPSVRALASPSSLKGVLSAPRAAAALAAGFRLAGAEAEELPVADGGDGTAEVLALALGGEWGSAVVSGPLGEDVHARFLLLPDGRAVVESAAALGFQTVSSFDPVNASSRGLGELILAAAASGARELLVGLGGTVTVDGGAGMREVLDELPLPTRVACDVSSPLLDAAYVFAAQKGATPEQVEVLADRLRGLPDLPGAGAAGGLGGALAALGAELVPGAPFILDLIGFDPRGYDLVVTGEGAVDETTFAGKAPGEVVRRCRDAGVRCELFSARDDFSGDPARAREDLVAFGERLARQLV